MNYLVLNEEEELLDVLNFNSDKELNDYKTANPTHIIKEEKDLIIDEDDYFYDDNDEAVW